jgi:mRNA-degrading endonuclease RelE of RelBE toxin-antitoxin system
MDRVNKALKKLSVKEQQTTLEILRLIRDKKWSNLNRKKLKGYNDIYRVRSGKIRIIYQENIGGKVTVLAISRRNDNTYNL